jgi:asparagine synthase (glutamine-hydrolysing)
MCGINGVFYFNNPPLKEACESKINQMNNTIIHRGPDSDGLYIKNNIALGFRRLSIIDLSSSANQPMLSKDGFISLVFNGEIYNYIELYDELVKKGYEFNTKSDTEVIINAYLEWGQNCVKKFNGMWAFAIYNSQKNELFASRDRFGVKPFYYHVNDNYLIFSSETKAIVSVENLREANKSKAFEYLAYGYNKTGDGKTFYKEINELLPGTNIIIKNNSLRFETYWELKPNQQPYVSKEKAYQEFTNLIVNAIQIRYRSDVPIAMLLSGGLDSSVIALITEQLKANGLLDQNTIEAFSVQFPGYVNDESEITKAFAKTCKHIHLNTITPNLNEIITHLPKIVFDMDQPLGSFSHIIHNQMMKEIHGKGIKVALNGQGADEAFYGYDKYVFGYFLLDRLFGKKFDFFKQLRAIHSTLGFSYKMIVSQLIKALLNKKKASYLRSKYVEKNINCLAAEFIKANYNNYLHQYQFSIHGTNMANYAMEQITDTGLTSILHYEDVSSMNASVEMRSPFLDYRIIEFAFSIPDDLKFDLGITKKIIRETVGKDLPDNIVNNRKKIGLTIHFLII